MSTQQSISDIAALADLLSNAPGVYRVTISNGSGTKVVDVSGTPASAWKWVEKAIEHGFGGPGAWAPVSIDLAGPPAPAFQTI